MPVENEPSRPPTERKPVDSRCDLPFTNFVIEPVNPPHCAFWPLPMQMRPAAPAFATYTAPSGPTVTPRGLFSPDARTRTPLDAPVASCAVTSAQPSTTAATAARRYLPLNATPFERRPRTPDFGARRYQQRPGCRVRCIARPTPAATAESSGAGGARRCDGPPCLGARTGRRSSRAAGRRRNDDRARRGARIAVPATGRGD